MRRSQACDAHPILFSLFGPPSSLSHPPTQHASQKIHPGRQLRGRFTACFYFFIWGFLLSNRLFSCFFRHETLKIACFFACSDKIACFQLKTSATPNLSRRPRHGLCAAVSCTTPGLHYYERHRDGEQRRSRCIDRERLHLYTCIANYEFAILDYYDEGY